MTSQATSVQPPKTELFYKTVGDYTITKHLGNGKFGEVRIATHNTTKDALAVKIIMRSKLKSKKDVDHINREITYMKMLNHPHLVALKEALQTTNNIYLFMELITGGDLIDRVTRDGRLPEAVARRYFQQMVVGVRYLHTKRIAHRDLKLDNVLYDAKTDSIKLADFGLANLADDADLMHTVVGSPHYVAPEVLRQADVAKPGQPGSGYDGFTADLWSLGVILFTMLTGRYPFDDPNRKRLFELIASGDYRMSRSVRPGAAKLIEGMLRCNTAERFTIQDILTDEWFRQDFDAALLVLGDGDELSASRSSCSSQLMQSQSMLPSAMMPGGGGASPASKAMAQIQKQGGAAPAAMSGGVMDITPQSRPLQRMRDHPAADQEARQSDGAHQHHGDGESPGSPASSLSSGASGAPFSPIEKQKQQQRPSVGFFFHGDIDTCATTVSETLRRMGCYFNKPEQEVVSSAQTALAATKERSLFGYCNPKALQVFHVGMTAGADSTKTAVSVDHKVGNVPAFEQFAASVIENLGAKASMK